MAAPGSSIVTARKKEETRPLLSQTKIEEGGSGSAANARRNDDVQDKTKYATPPNLLFCIFCLISGQFVISIESNWKLLTKFLLGLVIVLSTLFAGISLLLNLGSIVFDSYAVFACPFPNCGLIAGPYIYRVPDTPYNGSSIANITASHHDYPTKDRGYFTFQDAVITVATISGSLSYLIMMFRVLVVKYSQIHSQIHKCIPSRCKSEIKIINPFFPKKSATEDFEPAELNIYQSFCFYAIFLLCLLLYAGNVITLFMIAVKEHDNIVQYKSIDYAGLCAQLVSQYCAIISCFIFSKVAYAISLRCHEQLDKYTDIIIDTHKDCTEKCTLQALEEKDMEYVNLCNKSMKPYRIWFSVHWFLYAVTAFMSIAYLVDTIVYRDDYDSEIRYLTLSYVALFTLQHTVLFMYPCFRAASLLEARNTLIHRVSLKNWDPNIKSKFMQFMKEQRCGFLLSIICVRVEFGFNIAYLSIFFGFIELVVKVFSLT